MREVPTPELDKLKQVVEQSQTLGEFIEWLRSLSPRKRNDVLLRTPIEKTLATWFEIDLQKVDDEERALLSALRRSPDDRQLALFREADL